MTDTARLRRIIRERGYSVAELAEELGITASGLSRRIRNEGEFRTAELDRLCRLLRIDGAEERRAIFFAGEVDGKSTNPAPKGR